MTKIIKISLILLEMTIFALGALVVSWIVFPIIAIFVKGTKRRKVFSDIIHKLWKFFIWIIEATKIVKVHMEEDLSLIKNKIITASHPSLIDIVFLIGIIPNSLCLAKKELLHNPVMRNIVKSLYIINNIDTETLKKTAKEVLAEGYNIIIFPTGTRTLPDETINIHKGAALLAIDNNINIVPIKISADFPFMAKHKNPLNVSNKTVNYYLKRMPEINIDGFKSVEFDEIKLRHRISDAIKQSIN